MLVNLAIEQTMKEKVELEEIKKTFEEDYKKKQVIMIPFLKLLAVIILQHMQHI